MPRRAIEYIRSVIQPPVDPPSDEELLSRFATDRDAGAFELLVWRHTALVLRVCRGVLRDHHAAEDAAQAVFLALARQAGTVRGSKLTAWLFRVARRIAIRASRRLRMQPIPSGIDPDTLAALDSLTEPAAEEERILHEEIARLPERYRMPILLCFFDGMSHAAAARHLGCPVGTVASRLARAKEMLAHRLTQRGLGIGILLAAPTVLAPQSFAATTSKAAVAFALKSGSGVAALVFELAKYEVHAMIVTQTLRIAGVVAACSALALGVGWAAAPAEPAQPVVAVAPQAKEPAAKNAAPTPSDFFQRQTGVKRLQQLGPAIHAYCYAHNDRLPTDIVDKSGKALLSWRVAILPELDQDYLYSQFRLNEPWDSDHNKKLLPHLPKVLRSPGAAEGETRIQMFSGPGAALEPGKVVRLPQDFRDGTSQTLLAVEAGSGVPWTKPADLPFDAKKPLPPMEEPFPDGFATLWADGSGRWVKRDVGEKWLRAVIGRDDGEPLFEPETKPEPARPLTEDEKKELAWLKSWFARTRELQKREAEGRFRLMEELRKAGVDPLPEPPPGDDLDAWYRATRTLRDIQQQGVQEWNLMRAALEKKNPQAAAQLRKDLAPLYEKPLPRAEGRYGGLEGPPRP